jgi:hypothetical protein
VHVEDASPELAAVLELVGLASVLTPERTGVAESLREVLGQAEDGEEPGVDEVVMPDDPVA